MVVVHIPVVAVLLPSAKNVLPIQASSVGVFKGTVYRPFELAATFTMAVIVAAALGAKMVSGWRIASKDVPKNRAVIFAARTKRPTAFVVILNNRCRK